MTKRRSSANNTGEANPYVYLVPFSKDGKVTYKIVFRGVERAVTTAEAETLLAYFADTVKDAKQLNKE